MKLEKSDRINLGFFVLFGINWKKDLEGVSLQTNVH
jgi:hypothetical protein